MEPVSRAPVIAFSGVFAVGVLLGLASLLGDGDATSSGASVAVANAVHVAIALVLVVTAGLVHRRDPALLRRLVRWPVTAVAWRRLVHATVAVPVALAQVVLAVARRRDRVGRIERWRRRFVAAAEVDRRPRPLRALGMSPVLTVLALLVWFAPLRAGMQVFAGLDPDFVRDAWGGPTYVGAALAHWMDLTILFGVALFLIDRLTYAPTPEGWNRSSAGATDGRS